MAKRSGSRQPIFLIPFLLLKRTPAVRKEWLHALSQVFLEIFDQADNDRTAHVQMYSNNDLINEAVERPFGLFRPALDPLVHKLQDRLVVAQGFLHSDFSSRISVCLKTMPTPATRGWSLNRN